MRAERHTGAGAHRGAPPRPDHEGSHPYQHHTTSHNTIETRTTPWAVARATTMATVLGWRRNNQGAAGPRWQHRQSPHHTPCPSGRVTFPHASEQDNEVLYCCTYGNLRK